MTLQRHTWLWVGLTVLACTQGCIWPSPKDKQRSDLGPAAGPGEDEGSPFHRPGQPCLVCHGSQFVVAGTVFHGSSDPATNGAAGVRVAITDADGRAFTPVLTNLTGNFMVRIEGGLAAPVDEGEGRLAIPFTPRFPLRVTVSDATMTIVRPMRSLIEREGSCAGCHGPSPGASSAGRVYLEGP